MLDNLKELDEKLLLFLNGLHTDWLDPIMYLVTKTEFWIPLYLLLIFLIFKTYKKEGWLVMAGIVVVVLLTDRITSGFMKPFFHRLRPSHEPSLEGLIHLVNGYRGGQFGFASSHAANTFGVAFFVFFLFRQQYKWIAWVFIWPLVMTYTRIYLGVHYPGDILVGTLVGLGSALVGYRFYKWLRTKIIFASAEEKDKQ